MKNNYYDLRYVTITNASQSYFIDSTYVGSNGYSTAYSVTVNTVTASTASDPKVVNDPQSLSLTYDPSDSTTHLTWRKSLYPSAFKDAVIMENGNVRNSVTTASDTTYDLKLNQVVFGNASSVSLTVNSKYPPKNNNYYPFTGSATIANPTGAKRIYNGYQQYYYNKTLGAVMGFDGHWIRIYNSSMRAIDSIAQTASFSMPYPGNYIYYSSGGITQLNLLTRATKKVPTQSHYGHYSIGPAFVSGADNQLASCGIFDQTGFPYLEYQTDLADMNSDSIVNYQYTEIPYDPNQNYSFTNRVLSDDGRYAIMGSYIYQITNNTFNLIGSVSGTLQFRPDNSDQIIKTSFPTQIISTSSLSILNTVSPPFPGFTQKNYDPVTKNILFEEYNVNRIYLVNIDTGVAIPISAFSIGWTFINGYLISNTGYYLKIM
ncbi:MAG: hypothetical protein QM734_15180 [Cyclobacteriaceae bacterium]